MKAGKVSEAVLKRSVIKTVNKQKKQKMAKSQEQFQSTQTKDKAHT